WRDCAPLDGACERASRSFRKRPSRRRQREHEEGAPRRPFFFLCYGFLVDGVPKSTLGASRFPAFDTSKYFRGFAPVNFAVSACGNCRMYALYWFTASL